MKSSPIPSSSFLCTFGPFDLHENRSRLTVENYYVRVYINFDPSDTPKRFSLSPGTAVIMQRAALVLAVMILAVSTKLAAASPTSRTGGCSVGIYQLDDGSKLDVGLSDGDNLRWRKQDGTTGLLTRDANNAWSSTLGWTGRPDGKRVSFECDTDAIIFAGIAGKQIPLQVTNVTFQGAGVSLAGRLVMPKAKSAYRSWFWFMDRNAIQHWIPILCSGSFRRGHRRLRLRQARHRRIRRQVHAGLPAARRRRDRRDARGQTPRGPARGRPGYQAAARAAGSRRSPRRSRRSTSSSSDSGSRSRRSRRTAKRSP